MAKAKHASAPRSWTGHLALVLVDGLGFAPPRRSARRLQALAVSRSRSPRPPRVRASRSARRGRRASISMAPKARSNCRRSQMMVIARFGPSTTRSAPSTGQRLLDGRPRLGGTSSSGLRRHDRVASASATSRQVGGRSPARLSTRRRRPPRLSHSFRRDASDSESYFCIGPTLQHYGYNCRHEGAHPRVDDLRPGSGADFAATTSYTHAEGRSFMSSIAWSPWQPSTYSNTSLE